MPQTTRAFGDPDFDRNAQAALAAVRDRIRGLDADPAAVALFGACDPQQAVRSLWSGWDVVATKIYPASAAESVSGREGYILMEPTQQVFILSTPQVWVGLDVLTSEPPLYPAYTAHTWDSLAPAARADRVGAHCLARVPATGRGPIGLAHDLSTRLVSTGPLTSEHWWATCRIADTLLSVVPDQLPTADLADQMASLLTLSALGGFGDLIGIITRAGHRPRLATASASQAT